MTRIYDDVDEELLVRHPRNSHTPEELRYAVIVLCLRGLDLVRRCCVEQFHGEPADQIIG